MSTFPFFSVPVLASNEILKNLCLEDLIFLSTCSKRAYSSVKTANIVLSSLHMQLDKGATIYIEDSSMNYYLYFYIILWNENDRSFKITLNGVTVSWACGSFSPFYTDRVTVEKTLELIFEYIRSLFKVKNLDLYLRPGVVENFFLWKFTKTINELEIDSEWFFMQCASKEEIKFAVEELNVKILKIWPDRRRFYEGGLKQKEVQIEQASWLHINALLNSESSRIWLSYPRFSSSDLNLFVKNWIAGIGLDNFYHLHINKEYKPFDDEFQEKVLEDIETVKWDIKNRPENFENNKLGAGRDFRRADGTWATVLVYEENFIFHVWK